MEKTISQPKTNRTGKVLAASAFFSATAIVGSSHHDYRHPALTYEIPTSAISERLKTAAAGSIQSKAVSEFASLLADRLQPNLVPVGFLHQCQCIRSEILRSEIAPETVPELNRLREQGDPDLKKMLFGFISNICPSICPSDYARILLNELRPELEVAQV